MGRETDRLISIGMLSFSSRLPQAMGIELFVPAQVSCCSAPLSFCFDLLHLSLIWWKIESINLEYKLLNRGLHYSYFWACIASRLFICAVSMFALNVVLLLISVGTLSLQLVIFYFYFLKDESPLCKSPTMHCC